MSKLTDTNLCFAIRLYMFASPNRFRVKQLIKCLARRAMSKQKPQKMKKQLLFIAFAGLFTTMASAADLYVRDLGAGGAYPTIGAAITAAVDGDRIIIRPKSGSLPYIENITIDKSLSFVSEINFSKYILQGTISVTPAAGRTVTIHNIQISGTNAISVTADTTGGRTTLSLLNAITSSVNAAMANTTLNMSGCTGTAVAFTHGRFTGNKVTSFTVNTATIDTNPATDDIEIIANAISGTGIALSMTQKNYNFRILNNFIGSGYVNIQAVKNNSTNEIINNVISSSTDTSGNSILYSITIYSPAGFTGLVSVLNNVLYYASSSYSYYYPVIANGVSCYVYYNISNSNQYHSSFIMPSITNSGDNTNTVMSLNTSVYTINGLPANSGSPEDDYADTDLSRNNHGNFGGSDNWMNYWPGSGDKPQVNYLKTPRRIYTGTTEMNATGSGFSK
jgi:hypothetical protein